LQANSEYDWLIIRTWGKCNEDKEVCILTTRGFLLARYVKDHIRQGLKDQRRIPGVRRYKTQSGADAKAMFLNRKFKTSGYLSIREDQI
jgi:hypothetical protein